MSETTEKDDPPKPFSALSFETPHDPGTLTLSDSDPELSDDAEVESVSAEEEEDDEQDARETVGHAPSVEPFSLKGTNWGFSLRSDNIFGGLLDIQKSSSLSLQSTKGKEATTTCVEKSESSDSDAEQEVKSLEPLSKGRSNTTTTKRPAPARPLPDYVAHPERWTKYSLEDVPDTSERTNRNTALSFLTELKRQKEAKAVPSDSSSVSYNQDSSSATEGRILFKKPQKKCQKGDEKSEAQSGLSHMAASWEDDGGDDVEALGEEAKAENLGFHGIKKRPRKNLRPKPEEKEEEGDAS